MGMKGCEHVCCLELENIRLRKDTEQSVRKSAGGGKERKSRRKKQKHKE